MILHKLYHFYGKAPAPLRKFIVASSGILRLLLRPFLRKIKLGGYIQILDPTDNGALNCFAQRENYEKFQVNLFLSYLSVNPGEIILDIGANYGQYSLAAANIGRYGMVGKIFAFEPDSVPFRCLQESVHANGFTPFFSVEQIIIGGKNGVGKILKSASSSLSNRTFVSKSAALKFKGSEECRIASIDDIMGKNNISLRNRRVFIKIDIEGNEPKALRGARNLLANVEGYFIQFEYYPYAMKEASEDPRLFRDFLASLSMDTVLVIEDDSVRSIAEDELFAIMERLDINAQPLVAKNFVVIKNCRHPEFISRMFDA